MQSYLTHTFSTDDFDLVSIIDELPLWSAPFGMKLLDAINLKSNMNVLDIGCGLGFPAIEIAQRLGDSCHVFALDPWDRAIERTNLKIKTYDIENVTAVIGVAEQLPFEDHFFDLIVSNNGINNVEDLSLSAAECFRVSKSNAQFVITMNLEESMIEFYSVFEDILRENRLKEEIEKMKEQIYFKRKPLEEVKTVLINAGFKINSIQEDSFQIRFLDGITMFNHSLIKYWFLDGWKSVLQPKDFERIFSQLEERLNAIAKENGELSLTIPYVTIDLEQMPEREVTSR